MRQSAPVDSSSVPPPDYLHSISPPGDPETPPTDTSRSPAGIHRLDHRFAIPPIEPHSQTIAWSSPPPGTPAHSILAIHIAPDQTAPAAPTSSPAPISQNPTVTPPPDHPQTFASHSAERSPAH